MLLVAKGIVTRSKDATRGSNLLEPLRTVIVHLGRAHQWLGALVVEFDMLQEGAIPIWQTKPKWANTSHRARDSLLGWRPSLLGWRPLLVETKRKEKKGQVNIVCY